VSLPGWLEPLPDAARMRAVDAWAIQEQGVPSLELMERAGFGLAELVARRAPEGRVAVVCGKGNNGGDGLVAARLLRDDGREVDVLLTAPAEELSGDPAANLERLPGAPPAPFAACALDGAAVVVDALLGTGFEGEPRDPVPSAITAIDAARDAGAQVVAADVPSGVDASTGEVAGAAVRASATATFHAAKPGLWIAPGKTHAGEVEVIEIGIPRGAPMDADVGLITAAVAGELPTRAPGGTKFSSGAVLVCGGSLGLTGAPCLSAEAAMRAGAGYVTALIPASLNLVFEQRLLEAMTRPLPDEDGALVPAAAERVLEAVERGDALVLGPGFGRSDGALALARDLAARAAIPLVLDADGLNAHAGALASLQARDAPAVLTPHEGELGRLLDVPSSEVAAHRLHHARAAAKIAGAIVVLKGDDTLVARPDGVVAVNPGASAGLATAGTGDVLSGVVAALLARHVEPFTAACAAVHLHAEAGRVAAERRGVDGTIASDVIDALPDARARLLERGR
jgi:ADP-dependent NAD(P)H-hydrate dehydratase / NAD(P)H-hydrate epimerase